jgi:hypothetical protein
MVDEFVMKTKKVILVIIAQPLPKASGHLLSWGYSINYVNQDI